MPLDYRQLMQEQLDGSLDQARAEELWEYLQEDTHAAQESEKLERVHSALKSTPMMRAPQRLAATIMARLAKTIESQTELQPLPVEMKMALMMSLSIVQISMMPVMVAASYLVMTGARKPELLSRVMERTIFLMVMMIRALVVLLDELETMIEKDPDMAPVAMALIPVALQGMLDYVQSSIAEQQHDLLE